MNDQTTLDPATSIATIRAQLLPLVEMKASEPLRQALGYVEVATDFKIVTQDDAELAGDQLRALVKFRKETDEGRLEITRPLDAMKKEFIGVFDPALENANKAETILRAELTRWTTEQARLAEIERKKQEAAAEEERRRAREALEREQQRESSLKTEEAKHNSQLRQVELEAKVEETAVSAAPMAMAPKVKGFSTATTWKPVLKDKQALIEAAAKDPKLAIYLDFNEQQIGAVVRAMKEHTSIPGVEARQFVSSRVR